MNERKSIGIIILIIGAVFLLLSLVFYSTYLEKRDTEMSGYYTSEEYAAFLKVVERNEESAVKNFNYAIISMIIGIVMLILGISMIAFGSKKKNGKLNIIEEKVEFSDGFCPYCGNNNPNDFNFCGNCKKELPRDK